MPTMASKDAQKPLDLVEVHRVRLSRPTPSGAAPSSTASNRRVRKCSRQRLWLHGRARIGALHSCSRLTGAVSVLARSSSLNYERTGSGPPLVLLHGTNSSHAVWQSLLTELAAQRDVIAVDLPGHGRSPATSFTPPDWAREVAVLLDELQIEDSAVVGHSSGGWTALELAKLQRTQAVLALAPAGLRRDHSPLLTDASLVMNWRLGQSLGERVAIPLRSKAGRRLALRQISGHPAEVPAEVAIATARTVVESRHFPEHFKQTRRIRFTDGQQIPEETRVRFVWGNRDRIARRGSRREDELPTHARVEIWDGCGHMLMWDAPERSVQAALAMDACAR